jgi:hypothetical protein
MKKLFMLLVLSFTVLGIVVAQSDSTMVVTYTFGDSFVEFIKNNYISVVGFISWLILEHWLGKTTKVKAGSTLEVIINFIKMVVKLILKK